MRVAGLVVDTIDEIVHGAILGKRGISSQIASWCETGFVERLFRLLLDQGFHVYLTADHGNVEAVGIGRPNQGEAAELRGERARTYRSEIAAYPFFGRVAEIVGRLTALQGDCASAEVHRRMAEAYGEREGTLRMTNMVLQTQASWGAIERTNKGRRLVRKPKQVLNDAKAAVWLVEACVRYSRKPLAVATMDTHPIVYPYQFGNSLSYSLSKACALDLSSDSMSNQMVSLREIT